MKSSSIQPGEGLLLFPLPTSVGVAAPFRGAKGENNLLTLADTDNPAQAARQTAAVIDLMVELLSMRKPNESNEFSAEAISGLNSVLISASSQLENLAGIVDHMEEELNKLSDELESTQGKEEACISK